jgi:hypothetical protein
MLTASQIQFLSPAACKLYLHFHAAAQGRLLLAPTAHLARQCGFSHRTARRALAELLAARLILRQRARYHTPCSYLLAPTSSSPSHHSPQDRPPVATLHPQDRPPMATLLTPPRRQPTPASAHKPLSNHVASSSAPKQDRPPMATLLTPSDAPQMATHAPSDPLSEFVALFRQLTPENQQLTLQQVPPHLHSTLLALVHNTPQKPSPSPNMEFSVP